MGNNCIYAYECNLVLFYVSKSNEGPSVKSLSAAETIEKLLLSHPFSGNQKISGISVLELCACLSKVRGYALKTGHDPKKTWRVVNL